MNFLRIVLIFLLFLILTNVLLRHSIGFDTYSSRYRIFGKQTLPLENFFILDSLGIVLGLRKLVSDIAWIQLLQYYGGEPPEENHDCHHESCYEHMTKIQPGKYKQLINYCRRVTRLDPLYSLVYFYGVGALAWNLERPDEALEYLNEGLQNLEFQKTEPNTDYWELVKYQQAIYYKLGGKYKEMLNQLRLIVDGGKAPNMVKAILANLYKKFGYYDEAIQIWEQLLASGDPEYTERAKQQIKKLKQMKVKKS